MTPPCCAVAEGLAEQLNAAEDRLAEAEALLRDARDHLEPDEWLGVTRQHDIDAFLAGGVQ